MTPSIPNGDLKRLEIAVAEIRQEMKYWIGSTKEYRKLRDDKIDAICEKLAVLPCQVQIVKMRIHWMNIVALWGMAAAIGGTLLTMFMKHVFAGG